MISFGFRFFVLKYGLGFFDLVFDLCATLRLQFAPIQDLWATSTRGILGRLCVHLLFHSGPERLKDKKVGSPVPIGICLHGFGPSDPRAAACAVEAQLSIFGFAVSHFRPSFWLCFGCIVAFILSFSQARFLV